MLLSRKYNKGAMNIAIKKALETDRAEEFKRVVKSSMAKSFML
jgi:hypothetical protein